MLRVRSLITPTCHQHHHYKHCWPRDLQPTEEIAKRLQCVVFHLYLWHCHPDVHSSGTNCEWLCWPFKLSMNQASLLASGGYNSMCPKKDYLHITRKALRAEHGKAEMESMISQLESAKTRLEKEVLTIMILFLESLCLVKIQRKYVNLSNTSSSESWNHFVWRRFRGTLMFRWPICACPVRWSRRKLERLGSRRRRCCFSWGWPQHIFLLCSFSFAMRQKMKIQVQITCDQVQISWVGQSTVQAHAEEIDHLRKTSQQLKSQLEGILHKK